MILLIFIVSNVQNVKYCNRKLPCQKEGGAFMMAFRFYPIKMEGQNMLDADPIQHHLETEKIGRTLRCLGEIESTNTECYQEGVG